MSKNASSSFKDPIENEGDLKLAFDAFCVESGELEKAYEQLEKRYEEVSEQLQLVDEQLQGKARELTQVNGYLEGLLRQMTQGLMVIDTEQVIHTFNPAAEKIFGIKAEEVLGKRASQIFPDDLLGFSLKKQLSEERGVAPQEVALPSLDKQLEVSANFVELQQWGPGLLILLRDITELKRLKTQVGRNERLSELGEMAATIAHEIRNPLGGIEGFASLLRRDLEDNYELREMADSIIDGTRTLNHLVSSVLNYARPVELSKQSVDLVELLDKTVQLAKASGLFDNKRSLKTKVYDEKLMVSCDPHLLKAAILNLIVNAGQAISDRGVVEVKLYQKGQEVKIEVSDNGVGIAPEQQEKVFSPFFTSKVNGNGLGLAEVHKNIEAMGGRVHLDSILGKGSCFTLTLPA